MAVGGLGLLRLLGAVSWLGCRAPACWRWVGWRWVCWRWVGVRSVVGSVGSFGAVGRLGLLRSFGSVGPGGPARRRRFWPGRYARSWGGSAGFGTTRFGAARFGPVGVLGAVGRLGVATGDGWPSLRPVRHLGVVGLLCGIGPVCPFRVRIGAVCPVGSVGGLRLLGALGRIGHTAGRSGWHRCSRSRFGGLGSGFGRVRIAGRCGAGGAEKEGFAAGAARSEAFG